MTSFVLVTLMVDVLLLYTPVVPLRDALQSPWLVIHVVAAIIATGAFTLGGMCSALFLVKQRWEEKHAGDRSPRPAATSPGCPSSPCSTGSPTARTAFAFPIWTFAALIAGPIWAHYAWGRYWGWDPKEVWAFITWVVYAAYLHARATVGLEGPLGRDRRAGRPGDAVVQLRGDQLLLRQREPALLRRPEPTAVVADRSYRRRPCRLLCRRCARARAGSPRRRRGPTGPRGIGLAAHRPRPPGLRRVEEPEERVDHRREAARGRPRTGAWLQRKWSRG